MESISIANKILQDRTRSYKILQDSTGYETIHINSIQDPTYKILQDPARSHHILQDATRSYGILDKIAMESI